MPKTDVVSNSIISELKKKQILTEITQNNPTIPYCLLELIWDSVKGMDEKKLKQLRKGNVKGLKTIERPKFEDGQIIKQSCCIKENDLPVFKEILLPPEEPAENKITELCIEDGETHNETSRDAVA